jgi:dihydroorotase
MRYSLIIKNANFISPRKDESFEGDIGVLNGKIAAAGKFDASGGADEVYDATGKHILPGIIDAHVHFRDPGLTEKEDFESGTIAAAFGGVTCAADMPNVLPVTSTALRFSEKAEIAKAKSFIDFALFALLPDEQGEIEKLRKSGALGFKVFLGTSTGDIAAPAPGALIERMRQCASSGMRVGFHAETSALNSYFTELCKNRTDAGEGQLLDEARPVISEVIAIQTAICYAQYTGAKIHIHHVTSSDGLQLIKLAKEKIDVSAETCPHYLFLDLLCKNAHKVYPPLRAKSHRDALCEAVRTLNGGIDMVASDHAPHTASEKALALWQAPAGLCGVETLLPLMLNEAAAGNLSLHDIARLLSEAPAKIWGIYPQKGNLLPGADADFTVVDMNKKRKICAQGLHSKSKTSPYDGMEVRGCVESTIVRGKFIVKDGQLTGANGYGVLVSPAL